MNVVAGSVCVTNSGRESAAVNTSVDDLIYRQTLPNGEHIHILYCTNLTNASHLSSLFHSDHLLAAPLNSRLCVSLFELQCVVWKTSLEKAAGKMKTRTIQAEFIFNMAPSSHIQSSLEKLSLANNATEGLFVFFSASEEQVKQFQGEMLKNTSLRSLNELSRHCDVAMIKKIYKIGDEELKLHSNTTPSLSVEMESLQNAILSRVMTK